ncbi:T9SS type A sorting domain-containing protein [Hymenobacter sp. 15J16-1T3B]|uniref:T9SS type A sorting domain-containing protein n=1 Tax=Hymenobacter sp. 15J16-1T3B TaxID=2886941 RepID=UPI001D11D0EE|nr:T9SS type A sorting domain-containing protein [Hymenobacter sp. 15J16-1T3B]MCC3155621.1 T9SS type A sorting domain-containing protein [Hymenobacter sp. 15J16-1T3B]
MKRVVLLLLLILGYQLLPHRLWAQAASWRWAGAQPFTVNAVAADAQGNAYVTGHFRGTITVGTQQLTCAHNQYDLLVVKYSPQGQVLWAAALNAQPRYAGQVSGLYVTGTDLSISPAGEAYVVGNMQGLLPAALGSSRPDLTDKFVVLKVSAAGQPLWALQGSNDPYPARATGVATDAQGNCYLTGNGPFRLNNSSTSLPDWRQMFVLSLDGTGRPRWAMQSAATYGCQGYDIGVDAQNGVYVLGHYTGPMTFGTVALPRISGQLLAKLNAGTGAVVWARGDGVTYHQLAVSADGHGYVAGLFRDSLRLDGNRITASAANEAFIAQFTPGGSVAWLRAAGAAEANSAAAVAVADGQPVLLLKRAAGTAAVLARQPDGSADWEQTATGIDGNPQLATTPEAAPRCWVLGGALAGAASFGPWPLNPATTPTGFVAALTPTAVLATASGADQATGLQVYPNPARGQLRWRLATSGPVQLQLLDARGRTVRVAQAPTAAAAAGHTLDVAGVARGLYLLRATTGRQVWTARVQLD